MSDLALVLVVVLVLVLVWYLLPGQEHMLNEMNWATMSRGLNVNNTNGYANVVSTLSAMEKSKAADITVTEQL